MLKRIGSALERGAPPQARVVVITLDPWRDRPSLLESMRRRWELPATTRILSGEVEEVNRVLERMEIHRRRDERTGEIDHLAWVYVVAPDGRVASALVNPSARQLAEAGRRAAG